MKNNKFLPFLVSILPPSVFLLYLYQRNAIYLSIWHTIIAIAVFTICAVILHLIASKLVKSTGTAALICNVLWILFFTIKAPYEVFNLLNRKNLAIYLCVMLVITIIILMMIIRNKNKLQKQEIYKVLSVFWLVIFMFNVVPSFVYAIDNHSTYKINEKNYKTEFIVDNNLPSPNIYWLLMDGMLGFKAMEYFFNDPQVDFIYQLTERGFIINRDAQFEAFNKTIYGIPALMCPYYYDMYFVPKIKNNNFLNSNEGKNKHELRKSALLARNNNELVLAFNKKGYKTSSISTSPENYYFTPVDIYLKEQNIKVKTKKEEKFKYTVQEDYGRLNEFFSLLGTTTPLGKIAFIFNKFLNLYIKINYITDIQGLTNLPINKINTFFGESYQGNDKWFLNALTENLNYSGSKLVIIHDLKPHVPYKYNEHGEIIDRNQKEIYDPYNYPPQHYFSSKITISYIDYILSMDSEAVIVIQADHGLHADRQLLISKYGKNDDEVRLIQNQTINAIRIPRKYGGLEQPVESPNITRILVNRFVGGNYKMLTPEDIIK